VAPFERIAQGIERLIEVLVPQEEPEKPLMVMLTPAEAAQQMKLNVQTVREWCREGKLGVKSGSKWLISPDEVKQYLRGQLLIKGKVVG
jgi:excisionase family DNA binding protein